MLDQQDYLVGRAAQKLLELLQGREDVFEENLAAEPVETPAVFPPALRRTPAFSGHSHPAEYASAVQSVGRKSRGWVGDRVEPRSSLDRFSFPPYMLPFTINFQAFHV